MDAVLQLVDASFRAQQDMEKSLRDIDRRALNAMILVKRHGKVLAGYGVVAQAFRERAAKLREAAAHLQADIAPLIEVQMRILQHTRLQDSILQMERRLGERGSRCASLADSRQTWAQRIHKEEEQAHFILRRLLTTVEKLLEGIEEQEYVVTNGRIEAALVEAVGAPLMRVSRDMGEAVAAVADAIHRYKTQLENLAYESRTDL
ncbi:MAG: hypothetical protein ACP5D5_03850 [Acidithiobacillus sp.]|uniref:hypothetical protein n=1 Tax=Acidithiobacillus sp. TaxID=1872118 RepID=UPI003D04D027